ncbi:hypothetical protein SEA_YEET_80 [Mycobacterium phage Yeet]|uniref:Uncharacterized protein n=1 Tax=Mycobacterium phage Thibault TaxID=1052673 RepID=G1FGD8_9CAUD|nr:hypothetical protein CL87_gp073 [Mycobacterium phage Thibault]AEJ93998.1 hypothetical protein THIBAULT_73 [Mycobacterium phage Thibault]QBJ00190.1 hypothetical protein SEA_PHOEBUS_89 [Mycobacterium phage Phoebus]QED12233.1 hypothetical protein SEA_YEET_80 [Mycobacterium phage Yeet]
MMLSIFIRSLAPLLMIPYGQCVVRPMIDAGFGPWVVGTAMAAPIVGFLIGCVRERRT